MIYSCILVLIFFIFVLVISFLEKINFSNYEKSIKWLSEKDIAEVEVARIRNKILEIDYCHYAQKFVVVTAATKTGLLRLYTIDAETEQKTLKAELLPKPLQKIGKCIINDGRIYIEYGNDVYAYAENGFYLKVIYWNHYIKNGCVFNSKHKRIIGNNFNEAHRDSVIREYQKRLTSIGSGYKVHITGISTDARTIVSHVRHSDGRVTIKAFDIPLKILLKRHIY